MRWIDMTDWAEGPLRGDLLLTNCLNPKKARTMFVLRSRRVKRKDPKACPRYEYVAVRWWQVPVELRMMLYRSAERRPGGQQYIPCVPYPAKKRKTFEQQMDAVRLDIERLETEISQKPYEDMW